MYKKRQILLIITHNYEVLRLIIFIATKSIGILSLNLLNNLEFLFEHLAV